jgi:hypothetical protein
MNNLALKLAAAAGIAACMTYAGISIGSAAGDMTGTGGGTGCGNMMGNMMGGCVQYGDQNSKKDKKNKKKEKGAGTGEGTGAGTGGGKGKALPCGDYDGVPSHNDCRPVSKSAAAKCKQFIDMGNATNDPKAKAAARDKYIACVG